MLTISKKFKLNEREMDFEKTFKKKELNSNLGKENTLS